jgi:homoserine kinase
MSISTVTVAVPATTANIGPGFDCLGAALTLHNRFVFSRQTADAPVVEIKTRGIGAALVQSDTSNLVYQAFARFYQQLGQTPPPVAIEIEMGVPLARGLGSSATAIVGGLVGANALAGNLLGPEGIMLLAIAMEGHPDNVVPALLGGCRLAATSRPDVQVGNWVICEVPWNPQVIPVVAIPDFELSTAKARSVLPKHYSREDAIFNTAHLGLLLRGLETGRPDWLHAALQDRIHQPYRQALIPGYAAVQDAARDAGSWGLVISGAGPTLLALTDANHAPAVEQAMATAWSQQGIAAQVKALQLDTQGAIAQVVR